MLIFETCQNILTLGIDMGDSEPNRLLLNLTPFDFTEIFEIFFTPKKVINFSKKMVPLFQMSIIFQKITKRNVFFSFLFFSKPKGVYQFISS